MKPHDATRSPLIQIPWHHNMYAQVIIFHCTPACLYQMQKNILHEHIETPEDLTNVSTGLVGNKKLPEVSFAHHYPRGHYHTSTIVTCR